MELEESYSFCFALIIVLGMTSSLMMLAQGLKCNLLFLLLSQYDALRSSILFNKCKRKEKNLFFISSSVEIKTEMSNVHSSMLQSRLKHLS